VASPCFTVLVNAHAARHDPTLAARVESAFAATRAPTHVRIVGAHQLAGHAAHAARHGCPTVVATGGDGTASTVASALVGTPTALGILPAGTLNHFAKDLHMPLELNAAAHAIVAGHPVSVDVGEVNHHTFINNASLGAYPRLVLEREQRRRAGRAKWVAQAQAAFAVWTRYRLLRIALHNGDATGVVRTPFLFIGNNQYELDGVAVGRRTSLDRGTLHICLAPEMNRFDAAALVVATVLGQAYRFERFESLLSTGFTVDTALRRLPVSLDGEVLMLEPPFTFAVRQKALRVIAPAASHDTAAT
jgi:diacylglycerol kinase family enzyme